MKGRADLSELMTHLRILSPEWMEGHPIKNGGDLVAAVMPDWDGPSRNAIAKSIPETAAEIVGDFNPDDPSYFYTAILIGVLFGRMLGRIPTDSQEPDPYHPEEGVEQ